MQSATTNRGAPSLLTRAVTAHPARFSTVLPLHLRRVPLLFAACALALGIALSQWWRPAALLVAAPAALLLLALAAIRFAPRVAAVATFSLWLALGWTLGVLHPRAVPDRSLLPYADGLRRDVVATVAAIHQLPQLTLDDEDPLHPAEQANTDDPAQQDARYSADLNLQSIEQVDPDRPTMQPWSGTVRVTLDAADVAALTCGTRLQATVRLYPPREFRDPGVWNYRNWLAKQSIAATGTVTPAHLQVVSRSGSAALACRMQQLRVWAAHRLRSFVAWQREHHVPSAIRWSDEDAAAWNAMLFGDRTALAHALRSDFERTGTFHLFVISGLHVGLVAALVFWAAERLRLGRLTTVGCTAVLTTAYALLSGFGEPVQRALLMTLAFLLTDAIARRRNALNAVGTAMVVMLLVQPPALFEASLQMTVLIALSMAGIAVPLLDRTVGPYARACRKLHLVRIDRRLQPGVAQFRVLLRWIVQEVAAVFGRWAGQALLLATRAVFLLLTVCVLALVTELCVALPMAFYFHRVTVLALPANLLILPLLAPIMVCGMLAFLLCLAYVPAGLLASVPAALLLHAATGIVHALAHFHTADLRTPGPSLPVAMLLCAMLASALVLLTARRRALAWTALPLVLCAGLGAVLLARRPVTPQAFQVDVIDVGQGDSILLTAPNGTTMLIDAGGTVGTERHASSETFDVGEEVVAPYLWSRGVHHLDILALTHAHMDHLGGMDAVLRDFHPRELWLSVDVPSDRLHQLLADAASQHVAVRFLRAGAHVVWQTLSFQVLGPGVQYAPGDAAANDDSLVLLATYGASTALFAGDAEAAAEASLLAGPLPHPLTLLKVGHHGSMTSSTEAFLDALQPRFAAISCGRGNRFGHPRMTVLQRLQERHVRTARTDTMGAVEYTLHRDGSTVCATPIPQRARCF